MERKRFSISEHVGPSLQWQTRSVQQAISQSLSPRNTREIGFRAVVHRSRPKVKRSWIQFSSVKILVLIYSLFFLSISKLYMTSLYTEKSPEKTNKWKTVTTSWWTESIYDRSEFQFESKGVNMWSQASSVSLAVYRAAHEIDIVGIPPLNQTP